jgi:Na+/melibiose symporter-like transporter
MADAHDEAHGFYKLSWLKRIGYGAGDMAQNFIYQNVSGFISFFYTDVYIIGNNPKSAPNIQATLMFVVRIIDVIWDPIVGAFVDKHNPRWGKYRTYLVVAGFPLCILAVLCYCNMFQGSVIYAVITYTLLQICYTLTNVPYGALNASMTRDSDEIAILTSTRMTMANIASFFVWTCFPIVTKLLAREKIKWGIILFNFIGSLPGIIIMPFVPTIKRKIGKKNVFYLFGVIGIVGYGLLYLFSHMGLNDKDTNVWMLVANFIKSTGLTTCTGFMWALVPEVISYGEYTTGRRIAGIVNALTGIFFKLGFALGGALPGYIISWTGYDSTKEIKGEDGGNSYTTNAGAWFHAMIIYGVVGFALLVFCFIVSKERVVMDEKEADNVKVSDLFVEFVRNGPLRVVALYFVTSFWCMNMHNSSVGWFYKMNGQSALAKEGIRWCVAVIPAILMVLMIVIIAFYNLTDDKMEEIEKEIERRHHKNDDLA